MMMFFVVEGIEIPVEIGSSFQDSAPTSEYKNRKNSMNGCDLMEKCQSFVKGDKVLKGRP